MRIVQSLPDEHYDYVPPTPLSISCYDPNAMNEVFDNTIVALTEYWTTRHGPYGDNGEWAAAIYFIGMDNGPASGDQYAVCLHDNQFFTNDLYVGGHDGAVNMTVRIKDNTFTLVSDPPPTTNRTQRYRGVDPIVDAVRSNNRFEERLASRWRPKPFGTARFRGAADSGFRTARLAHMWPALSAFVGTATMFRQRSVSTGTDHRCRFFKTIEICSIDSAGGIATRWPRSTSTMWNGSPCWSDVGSPSHRRATSTCLEPATSRWSMSWYRKPSSRRSRNRAGPPTMAYDPTAHGC